MRTKDHSGVSHIVSGDFAVGFDGYEISANTAEEILVADYTGALVARGSRKVTLPRAGLYIVSVPARNYVKKIIVK